MLEEIVIEVEDRPGILADLGELLGSARVNIETLSAYAKEGRAFVHLVVDDSEDAAELLKSSGFNVEASRPVLSATLDDSPGELGRYCRSLSERGVAISAAYVMKRGNGETEMLFAVDDVDSVARVSQV